MQHIVREHRHFLQILRKKMNADGLKFRDLTSVVQQDHLLTLREHEISSKADVYMQVLAIFKQSFDPEPVAKKDFTLIECYRMFYPNRSNISSLGFAEMMEAVNYADNIDLWDKVLQCCRVMASMISFDMEDFKQARFGFKKEDYH